MHPTELSIDTEPRRALEIVLEKERETRDELEYIQELGRQFSEIVESIGHASFVLKDKGKSFGRSYSDADVDAVIKHDLNDVITGLKTAHPTFKKLVRSIKQLEE